MNKLLLTITIALLVTLCAADAYTPPLASATCVARTCATAKIATGCKTPGTSVSMFPCNAKFFCD